MHLKMFWELCNPSMKKIWILILNEQVLYLYLNKYWIEFVFEWISGAVSSKIEIFYSTGKLLKTEGK